MATPKKENTAKKPAKKTVKPELTQKQVEEKKAASKAKRAATIAAKKAAAENKEFNWTDERKQAAHDALLVKYNRTEPEKKKKLKVNYKPDGTATCGGRIRSTYSIVSQ